MVCMRQQKLFIIVDHSVHQPTTVSIACLKSHKFVQHSKILYKGNKKQFDNPLIKVRQTGISHSYIKSNAFKSLCYTHAHARMSYWTNQKA